MSKNKKSLISIITFAFMSLCLTLGGILFFRNEKKINAKEVTTTWDFSSNEWQEEFVILGEPGKDITSQIWDITIDGLNFFSTQKNRYNTTYIQLGGSGSTTERVFTFTAEKAGTLKVTTSNTGSSESLNRLIKVQLADDDQSLQEKEGGYSSTSPQEVEFSISAGVQKIYSNNGLRFYKIEYTYNEPELESIYISGTASKLEYTEGDEFDTAGLKVMGRYDEGEDREITTGITWTFDPETFSMTNNSVNITAKVKDFTSEEFTVSGITVNEKITVEDILDTVDGGFPTTESTGWINENGQRLFIAYDFGEYYLRAGWEIGLTESVISAGNNYTYLDAKWTFNMESNKLVSVVVNYNLGFMAEFDGTYYPTPKADDVLTVEGLNYVVTAVGDTNTVKVGNNNSFAGTSLTIPATITYRGVTFNVTEINAEAFSYCINLESITFAENSQLTTIGEKAFYSTGITEIEIPASVTSIGKKAFLCCYDLETVTILATEVPTLGDDAFKSCSENLKIKVPASSLDNYKTAWSAYESKIEAIPAPQVDDTFTADGFNYVVTSVGDTNTVKVGNNKSFTGTSVTIPATVAYRGVTFDVTEIGTDAFDRCPNLASVTFASNSNITYIGDGAFYKTKITQIIIPASVVTIDEYAFNGCNSLSSVTFEEGSKLETIGEWAFCNTKFTFINLPLSLLTIHDGAFSNTSLTAIEIPENVTYIGDYAFNDTGISTVEISENVTFIGEEAFSYNSNLSNVKVYARTVPTLGVKIFKSCAEGLVIKVPASSLSAYKAAWTEYMDSIVEFYSISDVIPSTFPTTSELGWVNETGLKSYVSNGSFKAGGVSLPVKTELTKDGNDFIYSSLMFDVKFVMTEGKLSSVVVSRVLGSANGTYKGVELIEKPAADTTNYIYDGQAHTYQIAANDAYTVSNSATQTNAGSYTVTVSLVSPQYKWKDGSTEDLTYTFVINKKAEDVKVTENGVEIDPKDAKVTIIEAENGIDPNAVFVVKTIPTTDTQTIANTENVLKENDRLEKKEVVAVYDAKLLVNDVEVQPDGIIKIKMLVPEEVKGNNFKLFHIHNGTEVMDVDYEKTADGYITFETDKLSEFAFATDVKNHKGLGALAIIGIILGSLLLLALIAYTLGYFFLYRKGKLDDKKLKVIYKFLPRGNKETK